MVVVVTMIMHFSWYAQNQCFNFLLMVGGVGMGEEAGGAASLPSAFSFAPPHRPSSRRRGLFAFDFLFAPPHRPSSRRRGLFAFGFLFCPAPSAIKQAARPLCLRLSLLPHPIGHQAGGAASLPSAFSFAPPHRPSSRRRGLFAFGFLFCPTPSAIKQAARPLCLLAVVARLPTSLSSCRVLVSLFAVVVSAASSPSLLTPLLSLLFADQSP
jgi:hypothetical protein